MAVSRPEPDPDEDVDLLEGRAPCLRAAFLGGHLGGEMATYANP